MDVDPQKLFFANLSSRQSVATRDLKKRHLDISVAELLRYDKYHVIATNNQETKKPVHSKVNRFSII